jgi:iron complex transport system substrate-binding protein
VDDFGHPAPRGRSDRIVSLNPAATELILAMGAADRLVGRTSWDLYSPEVRAARDLGAGIRPNIEAVLETRPDLVLLYASSDNRSAADRLRAAGVPTLSLKLDRLGQLEPAALMIGGAIGGDAEHRAGEVVDSVRRSLDTVRAAVAGRDRVRAFWHVWDAPLITIGSGSYLHELLEIAGGENVYGDLPAPSPRVELEDVARRDPAVVLAGDVGSARIRNDPRWRAVRAVRENRVLIVDTSLVGRPSARLGEAARSIARLLHPGSL